MGVQISPSAPHPGTDTFRINLKQIPVQQMKIPREITEQIAGWAAKTPGRPAITDRTKAVTFGRLWEDVSSCADSLTRHGVAEGAALRRYLSTSGSCARRLSFRNRGRASTHLLPESQTTEGGLPVGRGVRRFLEQEARRPRETSRSEVPVTRRITARVTAQQRDLASPHRWTKVAAYDADACETSAAANRSNRSATCFMC